MSKRKRTPKDGPHIEGGSRQARQSAAVVLEVLAGILRPAEAAAVLGITVPRYYIIERRALEGLVEACEPREKGPGRNHEKEIERYQQTIKRLENESMRYQALARAAQRSIGLSSSKMDVKSKSSTGRKRRKPQVRALKVCKNLKPQAAEGDSHVAAS